MKKLVEFFDNPHILIYFVIVLAFIALCVAPLLHTHKKLKQAEFDLKVQKGQTERRKMESERNLKIIETLSLENKENKRKLAEIRFILVK